MTLIDKIRAEIKKLQDIFVETAQGMETEDEATVYSMCAVEFGDELLSFLDTLEEPKEELMKEVKRYYSENFYYITSDNPTLSILTNIARHFAEWGAGHTPLPEDTVIFQKGVEEGKRLMMEGAVEGEVCILPGHVAYVKEKNNESLKQYLLGHFKTGEKVKIIIVKEDEHERD